MRARLRGLRRCNERLRPRGLGQRLLASSELDIAALSVHEGSNRIAAGQDQQWFKARRLAGTYHSLANEPSALRTAIAPVTGAACVDLPTAAQNARPPPFFFQAEDGIRAVAVTGVQTCALPI